MARQSMSPTQHIRSAPLFQEITSRRALNRAWITVRPRAIRSSDVATRTAAELFGQQLDRSIRLLQTELRSQTFEFAPQRGVLKRSRAAPGGQQKAPRPIVVAPVRNRIVQRALLDTCQTDNPNFVRRLGTLPAVIATPTSVGGLRGRGVPEAMQMITEIIANGATWFVRSDLKKFFQTVPKPLVEQFLRSNIGDSLFVDLFMKALATELENEEEVRDQLNLFPLGDTGVPQGSALSTLCANIVLASFDAELNTRSLHTVRYLDDFVILGASKAAVVKGWQRAQLMLNELGMECHDPAAGTGKASMGEVANGLEFLSFHIDNHDIYPTTSAQRAFIADIKTAIRNAKRTLNETGDVPRRAEDKFVQSLNLIDRKIRGWGDAFASTTKRVVFPQLDVKLDQIVEDYRGWFRRVYHGRSATHQRRLLGVALLGDTVRNDRGARDQPPLTEINPMRSRTVERPTVRTNQSDVARSTHVPDPAGVSSGQTRATAKR
jgi:RNA-directed DNA polymerase